MSNIIPTSEEIRAAEARARLTGSISALQTRVAPKALAQTALQGIVDKSQAAAQNGIDTAKKNPVAAIGALSAIALLLARRPIARLFGGGDDEKPADPKSNRIRATRRNAR